VRDYIKIAILPCNGEIGGALTFEWHLGSPYKLRRINPYSMLWTKIRPGLNILPFLEKLKRQQSPCYKTYSKVSPGLKLMLSFFFAKRVTASVLSQDQR
jgi:hypothetical protein